MPVVVLEGLVAHLFVQVAHAKTELPVEVLAFALRLNVLVVADPTNLAVIHIVFPKLSPLAKVVVKPPVTLVLLLPVFVLSPLPQLPFLLQ